MTIHPAICVFLSRFVIVSVRGRQGEDERGLLLLLSRTDYFAGRRELGTFELWIRAEMGLQEQYRQCFQECQLGISKGRPQI